MNTINLTVFMAYLLNPVIKNLDLPCSIKAFDGGIHSVSTLCKVQIFHAAIQHSMVVSTLSSHCIRFFISLLSISHKSVSVQWMLLCLLQVILVILYGYLRMFHVSCRVFVVCYTMSCIDTLSILQPLCPFLSLIQWKYPHEYTQLNAIQFQSQKPISLHVDPVLPFASDKIQEPKESQ